MLFKARNEGVGTENQLSIFISAAFKCFAIDFAEIGHQNLVAIFRFAFFGFERTRAFADLHQALINFAVVNFDNWTLDFNVRNVSHFDCRHHFIDDIEFKIRFAIHDFHGFCFILSHVVLRLHSSFLITLFQRRTRGFADQFLNDLTHQRFAVEFADMRCRHFTWAEAVNADLVLDLVDLGDQLGFEIRSRNHDFQFAFQTFGQGFSYLHIYLLSFLSYTKWFGACPGAIFQRSSTPPYPISFQLLSSSGIRNGLYHRIRKRGSPPPSSQ